jgi:RND family efflux transporter MFP subunit
LPGVLLAGFLALVLWAAWDVVFPPRPVTVVPVFSTQAEVQQEGTPLFKAAGWIEPRPTPVRVAALAPGVVEQLLVVEDQLVKAGEPIAELIKDDAKLTYEGSLADYQLREAEVDEANATLVAAKTRLEQPVHLEAAVGEADAALAKIGTQLKDLPFQTLRAKAQFDFSKLDYEGKIAAKGTVAGRVIDQALAEFEASKALVDELAIRSGSLKTEQRAFTKRRDALQKQLELLADEIQAKDTATADVKAAGARLEQARVTVAEAELRLDRMTVRAPIDGRVYKLIGHPGARVGSGMTQMTGHDGSTVVTLYRPKMLQIRVDVRFEDLPQVRLGQPVQIENPALKEPMTGNVLFISSIADIQKNTLEVKVAIDDPPPVFKPDMLVDVTFLAPKQLEQSVEPSQELRIYIPQHLILQGESGSFVWVGDQSSNVAWKTAIQIGSSGTGGMVQVTGGLTIASRLIDSETDGLNNGDRIRVTGESPNHTPGNAQSQPSKSTMNRLPTGESN